MSEPDIIPISKLTAEDRADILRRYANRDTLDSPWSDLARRMMHKDPPTETDEEWINKRIWERLPDGTIRLRAITCGPMDDPVNCPFYGRHLYYEPWTQPLRPPQAAPFLLMRQDGNECALVVDQFAPCMLDTENRAIDWRECPRVRDLRLL